MKRLHAAHLRLWVVRLAVASLLFAQSLGVLHRVEHTPRLAGTPAVVGALHAHAQSAVGAFFAGHQQADSDCRLYDQLTHADLASLPVPALPVDVSAAVVCTVERAGRHAAFEQRYSARGPPASA